jgi:hypothetical protein
MQRNVACIQLPLLIPQGRSGGTTATEPNDSDVRVPLGYSAVRLGSEQHDPGVGPGPVASLGLGRTSSPRTPPPQRVAEAELGIG